MLFKERRALNKALHLLDDAKNLRQESGEALDKCKEQSLWSLFLSDIAHELTNRLCAFGEIGRRNEFEGVFLDFVEEVRVQSCALRLVVGSWEDNPVEESLLENEGHDVRAQIAIWQTHHPELFRSERLQKLRL